MDAAAILPERIASTAVRGPCSASPPAKTPGTSVIRLFGFGNYEAVVVFDRAAIEDRQVSALSGRQNHVIGCKGQQSVFIEYWIEASVFIARPLAVVQSDLSILVDAYRPPTCVYLHAFGDGEFDLVRAGRHVAAFLKRSEIDMLRALAQSRQGDVDRDVAAADDDDARPDPHRLAAAHSMQEVQSAEHKGLLDAVNRDKARTLGAETEEHGVVILAEGFEAGDGRIGMDGDAQYPNLVDFLVQQVGRQAIGRNAVAQLPAGFLQRLEDLDLVTVGAQIIGRREAGRSRSDDADALAGIGRDLGLRVAALSQAMFGCHGLQRPNKDGSVAAAAHAGRFARRRADQAAGQRQRVVAANDLNGGTIVAMTEVGYEAGNVDIGRTGLVARRRVVLQIQAQSLRAGLTANVAFPLLPIIAQGAAQRPGGRQPLRSQLECDVIEGGEMARLTAAECNLGCQARGARQQAAHRLGFAFGQLPMAVERAAGSA